MKPMVIENKNDKIKYIKKSIWLFVIIKLYNELTGSLLSNFL